MKYFTLVISVFFFFISCGENGENQEQSSADTVESDSTMNELDTLNVTPNTYHGFIGDAAITAEIVFDDEGNVSGHYQYNKYQKKIELIGGTTDFYGGPVYTIEERDENDELTGVWEWFRMRSNGIYEGMFVVDENRDEWINIILRSAQSDIYIDPESKMTFEDQVTADKFFETHKFLNDETLGKGGIIKFNKNDPEKEYENAIPKTIKVYEHCGADGFCVDEVAQINSDGDLEYPDGTIEKLSEVGFPMIEIDYELSVLKFSDVVDNEFVACSGEGIEIYLSIKELEQKGYHLEGDGYWIKQKSGTVLGFFRPILEITKQDIHILK